ncbi:MAG: hypothetical protein RL223_2240 [Pseudomonadota bacterium]|jgi:DNA-binding Lrp family transcriptional regulator
MTLAEPHAGLSQAALPHDPVLLDATDARLIDHLHGGFPLTDRPFAEVGRALGLNEVTVIARLRRLLGQGVLTRFGPLFQIERAGGRFVLCAMAVPEERFDAVAAEVNAQAAVAHNYRRDHRLNLWFVIGTETEDEQPAVRTAIEAATGLPVHAFPKLREYRVELRLPATGPLTSAGRPQPAAAALGCQACDPQTGLQAAMPEPRPAVALSDTGAITRTAAPRATGAPLSPFERALVTATQAGLPLVERPYEAVGAMLGVDGGSVREALAAMLEAGLVRRIGAVPNHWRLGWTANGMSVWDVDDAHIDALGAQLATLPGVSHCYRRPRHGTQWPYNLFVMLHGRQRAEVEAQARQVAALLAPHCRGHEILYSTAILKKTGLRLAGAA